MNTEDIFSQFGDIFGDDVFGNFLGGGRSRSGRSKGVRGNNLRIKIKINLSGMA